MPNDKVIISQYILNDIANAIKTKTGMGEQEKIKPINMANTISSISGEAHLPITVNIAQSEHQTITVTPVNINNTSATGTSIPVPNSVTLNATIVAEEGYTVGTLNQSNVTANWGDSVTFSATAAEIKTYTITITQSANQTITVTAGGTQHTSTFTADYGTTWTATVEAATGYTAGTLSAVSGTVTENITISAEEAIKSFNIMGMVLVEEGNTNGTWKRIDENYNEIAFNPNHGTWAGIKQVQDSTYGEFTEIPITWVKTETLSSGPYAGKNCWWIADSEVEGFHVHPAFIGQDGNPHNLQIASWLASNKNGIPFSEDKGDTFSDYWNSIVPNTIHNMGWMNDGLRPYNIYDHHLIVRMMLIEFGTSNIQGQSGLPKNGRTNYHGIYHSFGLPGYNGECYIDGLTTTNNLYEVLAPNGSRNMIQTNVTCLQGYIVNCYVNTVNGINFGDLFIASTVTSSESSGSFGSDYQSINTDSACTGFWWMENRQGAFYLNGVGKVDPIFRGTWRVSRCVN